jgi:hypothetical protein
MFEADFVSSTFWSSKTSDLVEEENLQTALEAQSRQDRTRAQPEKVGRWLVASI